VAVPAWRRRACATGGSPPSRASSTCGPNITVTGNPVTIPARLAGGGTDAGGGGGGSGGGGGGGDPTQPLRAGGCRLAVLGTNRPDTLTGGVGGDVVIGFGGADRMRGEGGHDCLVGGSGPDRLTGGDGDDRLVGGRGRDTLVGGAGTNAYDAGAGNDVVRARNGRGELVVCGSGRDRAYVDRRDRARGCELSLGAAGR
jgi:Ca2+-binding RTX toxin-like protein